MLHVDHRRTVLQRVFRDVVPLCLLLAAVIVTLPPFPSSRQDVVEKNEPSRGGGGEIVLAKDLGPVLSSLDGEFRTEFVWKNETGVRWTVAKHAVSSGCCVRLALDKTTVKPGESLHATVKWKQQDRVGEHRWFAIVAPPFSTQPTLCFQVSAEILQRASVELTEPTNLGVGETAFINGRVIYRRLASEGPSSPKITFGKTRLDIASSMTSGTHVGEWKEWTLPFSLKLEPSDVCGVRSEPLRLEWDDPAFHIDRLVTWKVVPDVSFDPKLIIWRANESNVRPLRLVHRKGKPIVVHSTRVPPWMSIDHADDVVSLKLQSNAPKKGMHHLVVATNHGDAEADVYLSESGGEK